MTKRRRATHQEDTYMTPNETMHTTYDVLEIQDHRHLNNQTSYLVTEWSPEILTQSKIDTCTREGFEIKHIHPIDHTEFQPLSEVHWNPAWQLDSTTMDSESGPEALTTCKQKRNSNDETREKHHPQTQTNWGGGGQTISPSQIGRAHV